MHQLEVLADRVLDQQLAEGVHAAPTFELKPYRTVLVRLPSH
ncbi:hypothetical protein [Streptomyces sp. NPDC046261]